MPNLKVFLSVEITLGARITSQNLGNFQEKELRQNHFNFTFVSKTYDFMGLYYDL